MRRGPVVTLIGLVLAAVLAVLAAPIHAAEFLGRYDWDPGYADAGGYSSLWLDPVGPGFLTLSDRGSWLRGTLSRNAEGAVDGVTIADLGPLLRYSGGPLRPGETDAEGLTRANGSFYVSFEGLGTLGQGRVERYDDIADRPVRLQSDRGFRRMSGNRGLEALTSDAEGALYAIPEEPERSDEPFQVYRFRDGVWDRPFTIPREGRYLVSDASFGPDGRLYVLERDFLYLGFRTRLRSFDATGGDERVELETGLGTHDNLEGLSVWRDGQGRLRATMLSDDNQHPLFQSTEFVDYLLDQGG